MSRMCHYCGADLTNLNVNKSEKDSQNILNLNGRDSSSSCKLCAEKLEQESMKPEVFSSFVTPMISPMVSLSTSDGSFSSCSDFSVDVNSNGRVNQEEVVSSSNQEDFGIRLNGYLRNSNSSSNIVAVENDIDKEGYNGNNGHMARDVEIQGSCDGKEENDNRSFSEGTQTSRSFDDELDARIWDPPEPEEIEDDMEDDDDECGGDGIKWGKPSSLSNFGEEGSGSFRVKEEKQRAMEEVMNGEFKALVNQLLKSVGVSASGTDGDNWVDIVTSLSWEAALFVKPDATEGKTMDPEGYVKVKCIATGSRSQSQVFKGLVFKKHAAHKHMPTTYKTPKLLLIRGVLGQSSSGLSSFASMEQERDYMKSLMEMIDACRPNVVLVEKTASRDVQEAMLAKGVTLVFDMKLHRLERVARCTGIPIVSSDNSTSQNVKQCDSFHFQKFVEEHNGFTEAGKRPSKTLMFIEGCPTRMGCTILLKGSHSDELKRIKLVLNCAVVMAYQLILETSFLLDQRAMFNMNNISPSNPQSPIIITTNPNTSFPEASKSEIATSPKLDIPISVDLSHADVALSFEPYNPVILSGISSISASLKKVIGGSFTNVSAPSYMSKYFGFNGREPGNDVTMEIPISGSINAFEQSDTSTKIMTDIPILESQESFDNSDSEAKGGSDGKNTVDVEQAQIESAPLDTNTTGGKSEAEVQTKNEISTVLDSQSILVLMSSRNAFRGSLCEQSHFSHIMFYKNFDVPLGKFLRDNLLNQRLQCKTCGELPEAHYYYYAHHNKQLTIQVKRLPTSKCLPGGAEGKLWMWSRCGVCRPGNGQASKRVLISNDTRGLSFGKFLEISLSHRTSPEKLSSCGHSLQKDFLYFFGLGPMVGMLRYSPVTTYAVAVPPQKLEFSNSIRKDWLQEETENVLVKGMSLFTEVANYLRKIGSRFTGSTLNLRGSLKDFSAVEEMLRQERSNFEANIQQAVKNGELNQPVYKLLSLNKLLWEILLHSYIWDQRLHSLLSSDTDKSVRAHPLLDNGDKTPHDITNANVKSKEESIENGKFQIQEIPIEGSEQDNPSKPVIGAEDSERSDRERLVDPTTSSDRGPVDENSKENIPVTDSPILDAERVVQTGSVDVSGPRLENEKGWAWAPFSEIRREFMDDLHRGHAPKFEYNPRTLASIHELITEEGSRLHIPLDINDYIVSDYEGELSSVIACALALLKDLPIPSEDFDEDNTKKIKRISSSSLGSLDLESFPSLPSSFSEESRAFSLNGLNMLDCLVSLGSLHPDVSLGVGKLPGRAKYSVVCIYADRFGDLRKRCCGSEIDYIASLSRCKNWDAKGGKSKAFFAKTLDDRFIIKEIKKTEFDSFMKFASEYFGYMNQSFELGNQTCLAKILGIYQVTVRQTKSGRESKHDLMVMENLTFGRNMTRQYDLKGALHARYTSAADGSGDVLLDQNFVDDMIASPMYVSRKAKRILQRAVWNDTTFLNSINVMDYSLLVGVDTQSHELVCGIIDYLRQYTWDKQLETWVKSSLVVPRNVLPTVISPKEYKKRFRKFMSTHFLSVPDHWCLQRSLNPCKLCGTGEENDSSKQSDRNGFSG